MPWHASAHEHHVSDEASTLFWRRLPILTTNKNIWKLHTCTVVLPAFGACQGRNGSAALSSLFLYIFLRSIVISILALSAASLSRCDYFTTTLLCKHFKQNTALFISHAAACSFGRGHVLVCSFMPVRALGFWVNATTARERET